MSDDDGKIIDFLQGAEVVPSHLPGDFKLYKFEPTKPQATEKPEPAPRKKLIATPYVWCDPAQIPPRPFLYGTYLCRKTVSATVSTGGMYKTALGIGEGIAVALRKPILGIMPLEQTNVWLWNGEEPHDEMMRRIAAFCIHHGIDGASLKGRLYCNSGRADPIKLARIMRGAIEFDEAIVQDIVDTMNENGIGFANFDPLISAHQVPESDNMHIGAVAYKFGEIADRTNAAIGIAHHVRKPGQGQTEITVDDARGGGALKDAVRAMRTVNTMTEQQAKDLDIRSQDRRTYIRTDDGKLNYAKAEASIWYHGASVLLPNGDNVAALEPWKYPDPMDRITVEHMHEVREMAATGDWRDDPQSKQWIGVAVAEVADLDLESEGDKTTAKTALKKWLANGVLKKERRKDEHRKARNYVVPGNWNET